ncbi:Arginine N-methyltransferase 2 [Tulasnella sp. UAMH 9824]|nr:Arginine N-methyltransferase 2 [Tulasnella sp. UAMH 9824]
MVSSMEQDEYEDAIFDAALSTAGTRLLEVVETGDIGAVRALVKKEQPPMFYQDLETGWALGDHVGDSVLKTDDETAAASTDAFLASGLRYTTDENGQEVCMVDAGDGEEVGVMMGWEQPIMNETVKQLCTGHTAGSEGLSILNVGFGLGMIDTLFQSLPVRPQLHVIIEAHPDVLEHMQSKGWYDKPGVVVLEGKWQDFIDSEDLSGFGGFDVIYTDTFSEEYSELCNFFERIPDLLKGPGSAFSWFNGLGATNALFYDVYSRLAEMHLKDFGLSTVWSDLEVPGPEDSIWSGSRKYFSLPIYRLPICRMNP